MYKDELTPEYTIMQQINKLKDDVEVLKRSIPAGVITTDVVEDGNTLPVTSNGVYDKITSVVSDIDEEKMDKMIIDTVPTANSQNLVTSGGVKQAIDSSIPQTFPLYEHSVRLTFTGDNSSAAGEITFNFLSTSNDDTKDYSNLLALIRKSLKSSGPYYLQFSCSGFISNTYGGTTYLGILRYIAYMAFAHVLKIYYYSNSPAYSNDKLRNFDISPSNVEINDHYVSENILKEVL